MIQRRNRPSEENGAERALEAVASAIAPAFRLLIARGVVLPSLVAVIKRLYVRSAIEHFALDHKEPTDSRVSMLTGVHRRDVRSLRREGAPAARGAESVGMAIVGRWLGDLAFRDPNGAPAILPRASEDGPSFESLARGVARDVRPRTVLDDLLARGLVEAREGDRFALVVDAFVPDDDGSLLDFFSANLADHVAVSSDNVLGDRPRGLERAVRWEELSAQSARELEAFARERAVELLEQVNEEAYRLYRRDAERDDARERFTLGVYLRAAPAKEPSTEAP